jgi:hypothetical protein
LYIHHLIHACYKPRLSHFSLIWPPQEYLMKDKNYKAPHYSVYIISSYFSSVTFNYTPQHPLLSHPQSSSFPWSEVSRFIPHKKAGKMNLNFRFSFMRREDKSFWTLLSRNITIWFATQDNISFYDKKVQS